MLRYGMFVKTTKPVDILIAPCFQKLLTDLKEFYKVRVAPGYEKDYNDRAYMKVTLPAGTLGVFTYGFVGRDREEFKIVFPNPKTNRITKCLSAVVDSHSFTNELSVQEKEYLIPILTVYVSTRCRMDNLKTVETVSQVIDENMLGE